MGKDTEDGYSVDDLERRPMNVVLYGSNKVVIAHPLCSPLVVERVGDKLVARELKLV